MMSDDRNDVLNETLSEWGERTSEREFNVATLIISDSKLFAKIEYELRGEFRRQGFMMNSNDYKAQQAFALCERNLEELRAANAAMSCRMLVDYWRYAKELTTEPMPMVQWLRENGRFREKEKSTSEQETKQEIAQEESSNVLLSLEMEEQEQDVSVSVTLETPIVQELAHPEQEKLQVKNHDLKQKVSPELKGIDNRKEKEIEKSLDTIKMTREIHVTETRAKTTEFRAIKEDKYSIKLRELLENSRTDEATRKQAELALRYRRKLGDRNFVSVELKQDVDDALRIVKQYKCHIDPIICDEDIYEWRLRYINGDKIDPQEFLDMRTREKKAEQGFEQELELKQEQARKEKEIEIPVPEMREIQQAKPLKIVQPNLEIYKDLRPVIGNYIEKYLEFHREGRTPGPERGLSKNRAESTKKRYKIQAKALRLEYGDNPSDIDLLRDMIEIAIDKPAHSYSMMRSATRWAFPEHWERIRAILPNEREVTRHKRYARLSGREVADTRPRVLARDIELDPIVLEEIIDRMPPAGQLGTKIMRITGCRIGELQSLSLRLHGRNRDKIEISRKVLKYKDKSRDNTLIIDINKGEPLFESLSSILQEAKGVSSRRELDFKRVYPCPLSTNRIGELFRFARDEIGADPRLYKPHSLRHQFITEFRRELEARGITDKKVQNKIMAQANGWIEAKNAGGYGIS